MDDVIELPIPAQRHLSDLDPEIQGQLSELLVGLGHGALTRTTNNGYDDEPAYETVPTTEYSSEQAGLKNKIDHVVSDVARISGESVIELIGQRSSIEGSDDDQLRAEEALPIAAKAAFEEAKSYQEKGSISEATKALESMLAISLLELTHNRSGCDRLIRKVVAAGMADNLLQAISNMDGFIVRDGEHGIVTLPQLLETSADLIRVATLTDFDSQFKNIRKFFPAGRKRDYETLVDTLDFASLTSLAIKEKRHFPETSKNFALKAISKLSKTNTYESLNTEDIVETIEMAADSVQSAENGDKLTDTKLLELALDGIRSKRRAGDYPYRYNMFGITDLDKAVVKLVLSGRMSLAKALISSSQNDISNDSDSTSADNLGKVIRGLKDISDEQKQTLKTQILKLQSEKVKELQEKLLAAGADANIFNNILYYYEDPDAAGDISPAFWQIYKNRSEDSYDLYKLIEQGDADDIRDTAKVVEDMIAAGLDAELLDLYMIRRIQSIEDDSARKRYLDQLSIISKEIDEMQKQKFMPFSEVRNSFLEFSNFDDPITAFNLAKKVFGEEAVFKGSKISGIFYAPGKRFDIISLDSEKVEKIEHFIAVLPEISIFEDAYLAQGILGMENDDIETLAEAVNSPEVSQIKIYLPANELLKYLINGQSINNNRDKLIEAYRSSGLKQVVESDSLTDYLKTRVLTSLLHERDPGNFAKVFIDIFEKTAFLRDQGINVDITGHIDVWNNLITNIPDGSQGNTLRNQILARLTLGINEDPTVAIGIFNELKVDQIQEGSLHDLGVELIHMLITAQSVKGFPSAKPSKIQEVFFDSHLAELYQQLYALKINSDSAGINNFIQENGLQTDEDLSMHDLRELLENLKSGALQLHKEQRAVKQWLKDYSAQPIKATKLIEAWTARRLALEHGVQDNPRDILDFALEHGLEIFAEKQIASGATDLTREEFDTLKDQVGQIIGSRYSPQTLFSTIERIVKFHRENGPYPQKILGQAASSVTIGEGERLRQFTAEIFGTDDLRGFTIGYDTGCCMTITGASNTCIWAGYEDPRYSFFAVYDDDEKLRAQSIMYIAEDQGKKFLIIDNIETNQGTDLSTIAEVYKIALLRFIEEQNITIDAIQIGTGYMPGEIVANMPDANICPPTPLEGTYSDSRNQKILWSRE